MTDFVDGAAVVIVGGGIVGCSIAYHLCRQGMTDVLVLERNELASEATARAAGLVLHASSDRNAIRMVRRTCAAMAELADEFGEDAGFRQVGSIRVIHDLASVEGASAADDELAREGVAVEHLDPAGARDRCPWLDADEAALITFAGADGYVDGARLGMSYARAARRLGARIRRGVAVGGLIRDGSRVGGVATGAGAVRGDIVVVAAGAWSVGLLDPLGWGMPAAPVRSHYWITAPDGNGEPGRPNVLLPDYRTYLRSEVGGMVLGFQEPQSQTYDPLALPDTMEAALRHDAAAETDLLIDHAAAIGTIIPGLAEWRFAHHVAGLSMYTPDGKPVLGPVPAADGLLVAGGCCGSGIAMSGGIGWVMADMVLGKPPAIDTAAYDPGRFGSVEPASPGFRALCAAARSRKSRGPRTASAGEV